MYVRRMVLDVILGRIQQSSFDKSGGPLYILRMKCGALYVFIAFATMVKMHTQKGISSSLSDSINVYAMYPFVPSFIDHSIESHIDDVCLLLCVACSPTGHCPGDRIHGNLHALNGGC